MIMVTGASGALGSLVHAGLVKAGANVVAGSRDTSAFEREGMPVRRVDFDDAASLSQAFNGIGVLVMVSAGYAEDDVVRARHAAAIGAAREAGVRHVVYTSLAGAGDHLSIALAHRATERLLAESGLRFTVLRNGLYAELLVPSALAAAASGVLDLPMGEGAVALVAREDLAEAAVRVALESMEDDRYAGRVFELVGERALSGAEIAAAIVREAGAVRYAPVSLGAFRKALGDAGLLEYQVAHSVSIYSNISAGFLAGTGTDLAGLLGRAPRETLGIVAGRSSR
ncbi:NAD(P)H-binding protein [Glycomyces sp. NRRL B-16210]|uniref:NAD(P)H-binding protein n=1 Tax=Glycomyces sp. NRRL B-16210 TaxID=1463821 RepID=UPI0004BF8AD6|nr:NAD(P)H-binding protein [Glycomyces sp. NRRL B-16210]